ncbi:hypothetical protein [Bacillus sp. KH172YL63]|uniref:hypothetical protein n=1 Tax=Bacillus sp. KH172YL63 TaxID=2709784 RepID=UPI0013E4F7A4|nr:hypothetical protein [Bacillus sp. KH172YL63]BCB04048.1 hypothetical protein KH172YL63_21810 [Bacillus sp. KH172YL63]
MMNIIQRNPHDLKVKYAVVWLLSLFTFKRVKRIEDKKVEVRVALVDEEMHKKDFHSL